MTVDTLFERLTPDAQRALNQNAEEYPYMYELATKALKEKHFVVDLTVEELNCISDLTDLGNWNAIYTIFR